MKKLLKGYVYFVKIRGSGYYFVKQLSERFWIATNIDGRMSPDEYTTYGNSVKTLQYITERGIESYQQYSVTDFVGIRKATMCCLVNLPAEAWRVDVGLTDDEKIIKIRN